MAMPVLNLAPAQAGYSADPDSNTLRAKLSGGPSRFRLNQIGSTVQVGVQWRCTRLQFDYLEAFLASIVPGSLPFEIDLIIDYADPATYVARLIPDSKRLSGVQGNLRVVDAQLEVKPARRDAAYDQGIVDLYNAYGEAGRTMLRRLAKFANVDVLALANQPFFEFDSGMPAGTVLEWASRGLPDGTFDMRYTFTNGAFQIVSTSVAGGYSVIPANLAQPLVKRVGLA